MDENAILTIERKHAKNCLEFMARATLQGSEVNAFTAACNWLLSIAERPQLPIAMDGSKPNLQMVAAE